MTAITIIGLSAALILVSEIYFRIIGSIIRYIIIILFGMLIVLIIGETLDIGIARKAIILIGDIIQIIGESIKG